MNNWFDSWGRVSVADINESNVVAHTESCLSFYGTMIKQMIGRKAPYTWQNTYHHLEIAITGVENFSSALDFLGCVNKIEPKAPALLLAKEKISAFFSHTYFNRKISLKLHELKKNTKLSNVKKQILDNTLMSYNESFYTERKKKRIHNINRQLDYYESEFLNNMLFAKKNLYILVQNSKGLENVSELIKRKAIETSKKLNFKAKYAFSLEDDTYLTLMTHCSSRTTRKYIYQRRVSLASNQTIDNNQALKKLIFWRNEKAKINGHSNYTDYATSSSGLGDSQTVYDFLTNMKDYLQPCYQEYEELFKEYAKEKLRFQKIYPWDRAYIKGHMNNAFKEHQKINDIKIDYFKAQEKMFSLAKEMFEIDFEIENQVNVWDEKISCYKVTNKDGEIISHLYFDVFKRDEKPANLIYQYTINPTQYISKDYQPSQQTIVMHLSPDQHGKFNIDLEEMVTLFHEFGHALHLLLTKTQYHQQHPFSIEYDAIEFPSQWFERFALSPELIQSLAYQNKRRISKKKASDLVCSTTLHRAYEYWIHIMHSQIDIHLNTHFKPNGNKSFHDALAPIFMNHNQKLAKYNQFQNNQFEHFYMGSIYYGYLWAEHMVQLFDSKFENSSLKARGQKISYLLNKAVEKTFSEEFTKMVKLPYESELNFMMNNSLIRRIL